MIKREKVVVIGRGTALEHLICNLGRSLGHEMVSVSDRGRPHSSEPWVNGIAWIQSMDLFDGDVLEGTLIDCYAVVVCDHVGVAEAQDALQDDRHGSGRLSQDVIRQIAGLAERAGAAKFVWVQTREAKLRSATGEEFSGDRSEGVVENGNDYNNDLERDLMSRSFLTTIFRPTVIFGEGIALQIEQSDWGEQVPLEIVAMAALRASLEPDMSGIMEREAIEHYGDAMMIQ